MVLIAVLNPNQLKYLPVMIFPNRLTGQSEPLVHCVKMAIIGLSMSLVVAFTASATIVINFDTDAYGNPIVAPALASETVHLTELYAPLGIHFFGPDGPNGRDGGAIFNQAANYGLNPLSGMNFLGFNRATGQYMDGGIARDPETIAFDTLASDISLFAAGGHSIKTFLMQGFDANGVLVASDSVTTQGWAELEISWLTGLSSVRLSVTIDPLDQSRGFVFDDLAVDFVPEPTTISLLICAAAVGFGLLRKNKK